MKRGVLVILYLIACVALGAIADATAHMNYLRWGVYTDLAEKLLIFSGPFLAGLSRRQWLAYTITYICMNIAFFDLIYNQVHSLPWDYVGSVKDWDILLSKFPTHGIMFTRVIFLTLGVSVSLRYLR